MIKKYVVDFMEGEMVSTPLLISNVNKGVTSNGAPYLSITFSDKTGTIEGKLWDVKEEQIAICKAGSVILVDCDIFKYKNNLQAKVHSVKELKEGEYHLEDFLGSSEVPLDTMRAEIMKTIGEIRNPILHEVVLKAVSDAGENFFTYPAASKNHHNYVGGLAEHVYGMLQVAKALCNIYPMLNKDLLLSGVIVHDIGKLQELSGNLVTEYTTSGKLLGHISIMQAQLLEIATELGYENTEEITLLRHLVLSHHGEYEYGSPVLPLTPEAEALNYIDNIDARMNMLKKALSQVKPGEFTSRIFSLDNRSFYKNNLK